MSETYCRRTRKKGKPRHAGGNWLAALREETARSGNGTRCAKLSVNQRSRPGHDANASRIKLDPDNIEKGLAQLVLTLLELLRQLMERQAIHRIETGGLTDSQIERMGRTFLKLEEKIAELREYFGLEEEDLNINLGPLGKLM